MWIELKQETKKASFSQILSFIKSEIQNGKKITPPLNQIFRVFNEIDFKDVKVVILGQDPYPTPGDANGLAFATNAKKTPKSLVNIFKEIEIEYGVLPKNNNLLNWLKQGVLLLNTSLSTIEGETFAHKEIWQPFTDSVIRSLNDHPNRLVFILWGKYAQEKKKFIDQNKHLILETVHPSPLSAYRGFFNSNIFKKSNTFLKENNIKEIDWTNS